ASCPFEASPTTSRPGSVDNTVAKPVRSMGWSSTSRTRLVGSDIVSFPSLQQGHTSDDFTTIWCVRAICWCAIDCLHSFVHTLQSSAGTGKYRLISNPIICDRKGHFVLIIMQLHVY